MPLTLEEVSRILSIIDGSSCEELVVETDDIKLVIRRRKSGTAESPAHPPAVAAASAPASPQPSPSPAPAPHVSAEGATAPARAADAGTGTIEIIAPMVGTFYTAPAPDKPPFVEVGSTVAAGDPLCLIEVMKLFTTIFAEQPGRIVEIVAENGQLVEHGQLLFLLEPA